MTITAATLFSGIGAPEVAMPHWNWAWHAEIEKFPSAVMAARHPGSTNLGDVSVNDFHERAAAIARPDVLIFGSPCQSYSIAGKRLGLDDPRGNLALTALRIVARLKPRWFLFENVPGLFSSWSGEADGPLQAGAEWDSEENSDFVAFLSLVDELGYSGAWCVLDAQYAGVAQRRDRVFFAGHSGDWRASAAVLLEPEGLRGDHPPRRQAGQDVAGCLSARPTAGGGLGTDFDLGEGLVDVAMTLNAHGGGSRRMDAESETLIPIRRGGSFDVAHALRAEGFDASEDGTGRGTPLVVVPIHSDASRSNSAAVTPSEDADGYVRLRDPGIGVGNPGDPMFTLSAANPHAIAFSSKDYGADAVENIAPTLRAMNHTGSHANAGGQIAVAFHENQRSECSLNDTAGSLKVGGGKPGQGYPAALTQGGVRRLTPKECERLQGFPDDYTLIDYRGKRAADGPRYKALGNSMAVPVIRWILNRIEIFERDVRPVIERVA